MYNTAERTRRSFKEQSHRMGAKHPGEKSREEMHPQRSEATEGVERLDRNRGKPVLRKDLDQAPRREVVCDRKLEKLRDSDARKRRNPHRLTRISVGAAPGKQFAAVGKSDRVAARATAVTDVRQATKLLARGGIAYPIEPFGRCNENERQGRDAADHPDYIFDGPHPHGDV